MLVNCTSCNTQFEKRLSQIKRSKSGNHYCSRSCSAKTNNVGVQRNKAKQRICKGCKTAYFCIDGHRSVTFCLDCLDGYSSVFERDTAYTKSLTVGEYRHKLANRDKHRSWLHAEVRGFNRRWNASLRELPCQHCGYNKHVELCHKRDIADFPDSATLGEINSRENVIQLCRNCHWEFDNGLLTLSN